MSSDYQGIVPYLFFDDAEMRVGNTELWLDGSGKKTDTDERPHWIGIWVEDVDAIYKKVSAAGVA